MAAAQQRTSAEAWQEQRAADGERAKQAMLEMEEEDESVRRPPTPLVAHTGWRLHPCVM